MKVLAIDPGREKCGVCVMNGEGAIEYQRVIETARLEEIISVLITDGGSIGSNGSNGSNGIGGIEVIVIGDGTTSRDARRRLEAIAKDIPIEVVDEKHTTEAARKEYWIKKPPRGWRRLLPTTMQVPPEPVDHFVAEILARRFLSNKI